MDASVILRFSVGGQGNAGEMAKKASGIRDVRIKTSPFEGGLNLISSGEWKQKARGSTVLSESVSLLDSAPCL